MGCSPARPSCPIDRPSRSRGVPSKRSMPSWTNRTLVASHSMERSRAGPKVGVGPDVEITMDMSDVATSEASVDRRDVRNEIMVTDVRR